VLSPPEQLNSLRRDLSDTQAKLKEAENFKAEAAQTKLALADLKHAHRQALSEQEEASSGLQVCA